MRVMIAGGGTGGHLFPGIALAQELIDRNQGHEVVFVGTPKGLEVKVDTGIDSVGLGVFKVNAAIIDS